MQTRVNFFEQLALLGVTIHPGGSTATRILLDMLEVERADWILDVGCGAGRTLSRVSRQVSGYAVGVDFKPHLAAQASWRVRQLRQQVKTHRATTVAADALLLPFPESVFDVVFCESVLIFLPKVQALCELCRVAKPAGRIGMVELTWAAPPPPWLVPTTRRLLNVFYEPLGGQEWEHSLLVAGLRKVESFALPLHPFPLDGEDVRDIWDMARLLYRSLRLQPVRRRWYNSQGIACFMALMRYTRCGIYVGVKPEQ